MTRATRHRYGGMMENSHLANATTIGSASTGMAAIHAAVASHASCTSWRRRWASSWRTTGSNIDRLRQRTARAVGNTR